MVYGHVKRRIMLNELKPETVLTELGLAHEIGCSQGTIREALLRLQEDGLVSRTARRGTIVTRLTADEAQEMLVLRRTIETRGAPRAAKACTSDLLTTLERIRAAMDEAAADQDEYRLIEADKDFHLAIFRASGLDALEQILVRCIMHSHRCKLWAPGTGVRWSPRPPGTTCSWTAFAHATARAWRRRWGSTSIRSCCSTIRSPARPEDFSPNPAEIAA